ncbi:hypothetical protein AVEN_167652-1 [Araneus ventricosus]|uniref:Uncharacterized protein n=1 Tax=Araneus ventricosus TaxID=182803 RepID=A0A4Y2SWE6_ARAVE|nr:hypothetical protein AVEN_167652-1 [Araneus ventricosus]
MERAAPDCNPQGKREPAYLYGNFSATCLRYPPKGRYNPALIRTLTMKLLIWVAIINKGSFQFSLVILTSHLETTQGLFWGGTRNFELSQMTRTTPELVPLSPNFRTIPAGECLTHDVRFNMHQAHIHDGSSVK